MREEHFVMIAANKFSNEDYQLSTDHQLGTLLDVYRLKPSYIRFLRITGLSIFIIGIAILVLTLSLAPNLHHDATFPALLGSFYTLFHGGIFYGLMARRAQSMRVIVCEHGLLQIRKMIRHNRVEVMHWKAILTINKASLFPEYCILYREDEMHPVTSLTLSNYYQNSDELVAFIKRHL